jgi:hypothetical protein
LLQANCTADNFDGEFFEAFSSNSLHDFITSEEALHHDSIEDSNRELQWIVSYLVLCNFLFLVKLVEPSLTDA